MSCSGHVQLMVIAGLAFSAGCSEEPAKAPDRAAATVTSSALAEKICVDCHDDVKQLDNIDALLMLSAERMPPPEVDVDAKTRGELIRDFCALEYGSNDTACFQRYTSPATVRLAVPMPVVIRRLGLANETSQDARGLRAALDAYVRPAEPRNYYDPTLDAFRVAAASVRCRKAANPGTCIEDAMSPAIELDTRGMVVE
jgi:hypothetical protein